ncbi:MAG: beta-lactamase family protein [Actinobacteria bacterium]|nr:beta-lactamase family protein [Actinomycetota bacterium]
MQSTAAEVLHLVAVGKIDVDAPMSRYVHSSLVSNGATVRQALGMLAGVDDGEFIPQMRQLSVREPDARISLDHSIELDSAKPGQPGATQAYSNVTFLLLARAIESVTHQSYAAAVHADLLAPQRLTRIAVQDADRPAPPLAYPVDPVGKKPVVDGYVPDRFTASASVGSGSIAASAHDEALWGYALYTGRVLPASLTRLMMKPQRSAGLSNRQGRLYGLGTEIYDQLGLDQPAVGHDGFITRPNGDFEDGYRSSLLVIPSARLAVAVSINTVVGSPQGTALALAHLVE